MGPTAGLPRLITGMAEFNRIYGGCLSEADWGDDRFLAYAVQGFFENGGQRVYVERITGANPAASSATLDAGVTTPAGHFVATGLAEAAEQGQTELKLLTSRGLKHGSTITLIEPLMGASRSQNVVVDQLEDGDQVRLTAATALTDPYSKRAVVLIPMPAGADVG